jgi:hypothetical protein
MGKEREHNSIVMVMEMGMGRKRRGSSLRGGGGLNHLLLLRRMMTSSQQPLNYRGREEALILRRALSGLALGQVLPKLSVLFQIHLPMMSGKAVQDVVRKLILGCRVSIGLVL